MKLTDLEPQFIRYETRVETYDVIVGDSETWRERGCPTEPKTGPRHYRHLVETLAEAQGVWFLCPKCFAANGGAAGTHQCEVTFDGRGVQSGQGVQGHERDPRWQVSGSGFHDITITPSILLIGGCEWHGFVTNGEVA